MHTYLKQLHNERNNELHTKRTKQTTI